MFNVIVTEKGGDAKRLEFDKPEITIGRVQGNDIILPKGNVSKRHSRIVLKDGKFIIVDLKSTNGTYVNGRKITSPLVIKDSDKIYIGDFIITVEEPNGASTAAGGPMASAPPMPGGHASPPPPPRKSAPLPPPAAPDDGDDDGLPAPPAAPPPPRQTGGQPALGGPLPPPPPRPAGGGTLPPPVRDPLAARPAAPPPPARETGGRPSITEPPGATPREPGPLGGPPAPPPAARRTAGMSAAPPPAPPPPRISAASAAAPGVEPPPLSPPTPPPPLSAASAPPAPMPMAAPPAPSPMSSPPAATPAPQPVSPPAALAPIAPAPAPAPAPLDPKKAKALELQREIHDKLVVQLELARLPIERLAEEALWQRAERVIVDLVEAMEGGGQIPAFVDQDALIKDTLNETLGLGPLEDLLADDAVVAILVNRHDRLVVERAGRLEASDKQFSSENALRQVIERLVVPLGKRPETAGPVLDLRLPDGARLTAVLAPASTRGPCLALRKPRTGVITCDDLVRANAMSRQMADFLGVCVAARKNVLVCGSSGAGSALVLGALAAAAPAGERVVSVEQVAELAIGRDAWIALEGRLPDPDGKGGVGVRELVGAARALRPDRLVVGELAGAEAYDLLGAMASAQDGTLVGVAAEGPRAALALVEKLAALGAGGAPARAVRELTGAAVHVVVHVARYADGAQRVTGIAEVGGLRGDELEVRELFQFQPQGRGPDGVIRGRFAGLGVIPRFYESLEARGIAADPSVFK